MNTTDDPSSPSLASPAGGADDDRASVVAGEVPDEPGLPVDVATPPVVSEASERARQDLALLRRAA
ncbi:MAG: hypothetical protein JWO31_270, partial [Phycisphaerales bacterium]|nr:hypothetical protein [Phycisphaerales bacterium]